MQTGLHTRAETERISSGNRMLAIQMYVEGSSYDSIGRSLKVNPQSVANWVSTYTAKLPSAPMLNKVKKAELDELYTFVGKKKTKSMFSP